MAFSTVATRWATWAQGLHPAHPLPCHNVPRSRSVTVSVSAAQAGKARLPPAATSPQQAPPPPAPRPSYRVSLWDAMKFNGPAPELVNARLAMLGLLAAAHAEVETGQTVWQQAAALSPTTALLLLLTVYGTLVPVTKGAKMEAFGIFSPKAEIVNGRAAMLGFAALAALEYYVGVPFF